MRTKIIGGILIAMLNSLSLSAKNDVKYVWDHAYNGGGGFICGLFENSQNPDIMYARCDVGGIFRSKDGAKTWENINKGCSRYYHHQIRSFAISKLHPKTLFRCSGSMNDSKVYGDIMKSKNGGDSWYVVDSTANFFGNGEGRYYGDVIDVSPFDANCAIAGTFSKGVFTSKDEGETWKYAGLAGYHIGVVKYHPTIKNRIYVGVRNHFAEAQYLDLTNFKNDGRGKLFRSDDNGKTWQLLIDKKDFEVVDIAFDFQNPETFYTISSDAIYKTTDGGKNLSMIKKGVKSLYGEGFAFVYTSALYPNKIFSCYSTPLIDPTLPELPFIVSSDGGKNWSFLNTYTFANVTGNPPYIKNLKFAGGGISKLFISSKDPKRFYFSGWYGVYRSDDAGENWNGNYFKGLTTTCIENVQADPLTSGKAYFTCADVSGACSVDDGETYNPLDRPADSSIFFIHNGTAFAPSRHRQGVIVSGITSWPKSQSGSVFLQSENGGKTFDIIEKLLPGQFIQAIKESYKVPGTFYSFVDGSVSNGAGFFKSTDWGKSWLKKSFPFPNYINILPFRKHWVEFELLPITSYQQKNVCGCDNLLATDPFDANTIYIGEWTEGIFKTTDGGDTWTNISANLPFHLKTDSIPTLVTIKCDESRPNVLYAGFVKEGLWRSDNGGKLWSKIYPIDHSIFNASSIVVGGVTKDELYISCEPLYWSFAPSVILFSDDRGKSWQKISDDSYGALRWKGIAVNRSNGTIYGVTNGNGCFFARRK